MATAIEVARCLIHLAAAEEEPEYLTHLRLQKLLYYAQGWSLAMRDQPVFQERIEAWAHGPVVRKVYPAFADYGDKPIDPSEIPTSTGLSKDDRDYLASLWESYKRYSASSLREMTHSEQPWIDARNGFAPGEACDIEITKSSLKQFFKKRLPG